MSDKSDEEKNLDPSEQRKQEFREKGKVARSQEILGAAGLLVGFGSLLLASRGMATAIQGTSTVCGCPGRRLLLQLLTTF